MAEVTNLSEREQPTEERRMMKKNNKNIYKANKYILFSPSRLYIELERFIYRYTLILYLEI